MGNGGKKGREVPRVGKEGGMKQEGGGGTGSWEFGPEVGGGTGSGAVLSGNWGGGVTGSWRL